MDDAHPVRERLLARYRRLVLHELPRRARAGRWVVTADHCFGRIVLDHQRVLAEGDPLLRELDAQSLARRGEPPKR